MSINVPKLIIGEMPWSEPPSAESRRDKHGTLAAQVDKLYLSESPTGTVE
ncbi:MAG: hypothetical protein WD314_06425 [Trueperaceae bacterium]